MSSIMSGLSSVWCEPEHQPAPAVSRQQRLRAVYVCAFLDMCAASMLVTVLPSYLHSQLGLSATHAGLVLSIYGTVQFVASPLVGGVSDQYGRERVLSLCLLLCALSYCGLMVVSLPLVVFGRLCAGMFKQTQNTCRSIVCDVVDETEKIHIFGYLNSMGNFAFIFAPTLSGVLTTEFGYSATFGLISLVFVLNALFVHLRFPAPDNCLLPLKQSKSNGHLDVDKKQPTATGIIDEIKSVNWAAQWDIMLVRLLQSLVILLYRSNFNWFMEDKYQATPAHIGMINSMQGLSAFVFAWSAGHLINSYSRSRVTALSHATGLMSVSLLGLCLSNTLGMYLICLVVLNATTAVLRVLSLDLTVARCSAQETGLLIGIAASVSSAARAITPAAGGLLHDMNIEGPVILAVLGSVLSHVIVVCCTYDSNKRYSLPKYTAQHKA